MLYRIQTEDINRDSIIGIVSRYFDGFTIIPAIGYYRGKPEKSIIIEIIADESRWGGINEIGNQIRLLNKQECVLISHIECRYELV